MNHLLDTPSPSTSSPESSPLTFCERKAAEAAFRGLPLNPTWSESAVTIYHGILAKTGGANIVTRAQFRPLSDAERALMETV